MKPGTKLTLLVLTASCLLLPNFSFSQCINATGGTITYTDSLGLNPTPSAPYTSGYTIHTFTSSDIFNIISGTPDVNYLIVAGGGGGGGSQGGGGGAGGLLTSTVSITSGTYTVTVGTGGAGATKTAGTQGSSGNNSVFNGLTAIGGGGGGGFPNSRTGATGGSGGGGSGPNAGGTGTSLQGNNGGGGSLNNDGGGGGAGGAATNAVSNGSATAGGIGLSSSISGSTTFYAGGGGGGGVYANAKGLGGQGGGGDGGQSGGNGTNGLNGTGGGGGGASWSSSSVSGSGGSGGSGIVILRYKTCPNTNGVSQLSSTHLNGISINNIFPNPSTDKFEYEIGSTEKMTVQVRVVNMLGQIVINETKNLTKGISNYTLNVSALSSGTYSLQIITENKEVSGKQFQIK